MRKTALLLVALGLGACSVQVPEVLRPPAQPLPEATQTGLAIADDGSVLVPFIRSVEPERGLRGAILRVEGIAPTQGYWGTRLSPIEDAPAEEGVLHLQLRAQAPLDAQTVGPEPTRLLTTATFLTSYQLRGLTRARISAGTNTITVPLR